MAPAFPSRARECVASAKPSMVKTSAETRAVEVRVVTPTREAPVGDRCAMREIVRPAEQHRLRQPVQPPCEPTPGAVRESGHCDAEAVIDRGREKIADRA